MPVGGAPADAPVRVRPTVFPSVNAEGPPDSVPVGGAPADVPQGPPCECAGRGALRGAPLLTERAERRRRPAASGGPAANQRAILAHRGSECPVRRHDHE